MTLPEPPDDVNDFVPADPDRVKPFVWEQDGELSLHFELSSIQSRMRCADPWALALDYTRSMMACLYFQPAPRSALMIGLGGGSLPKYLLRHLPALDLTVVEINPHVIALRERFQVPPDDARFRVLCADGADHVARETRRHDLVMVDGFNHAGQPDSLCSPGFYAACRACLAPEGLMVVNLHADGELEHRLVERLDACFDGACVGLPSEEGGNRVIFAGEPVRGGLATVRRHAGALARVHRDTLAAVKPALWRVLGTAAGPDTGPRARGAQRTRIPGSAPGKGSST